MHGMELAGVTPLLPSQVRTLVAARLSDSQQSLRNVNRRRLHLAPPFQQFRTDLYLINL